MSPSSHITATLMLQSSPTRVVTRNRYKRLIFFFNVAWGHLTICSPKNRSTPVRVKLIPGVLEAVQRRAGGELGFCTALLSGRMELAGWVKFAAAQRSANTHNSAITAHACM